MVGDQHGGAGGPGGVQPAAAVGEHQGLGAGGGGGAHAVDDGAHALALVEVGAGAEDQDALAGGGEHGGDGADVAGDGGGVEAGQFGGGDAVGGFADQVRGLTPSGAEHQGDVVGGDAGEFGDLGGGGGGQGKGVSGVIRSHGARLSVWRRVAGRPGAGMFLLRLFPANPCPNGHVNAGQTGAV